MYITPPPPSSKKIRIRIHTVAEQFLVSDGIVT